MPGPGGAWSREGCLVWGEEYLVPGGLLPGGCLVPGVCSGERSVPGGLLPGVAWWRPPSSPWDDYCCGQYASYWNAFLLFITINDHSIGCPIIYTDTIQSEILFTDTSITLYQQQSPFSNWHAKLEKLSGC